jgi:hypothetical protein
MTLYKHFPVLFPVDKEEEEVEEFETLCFNLCVICERRKMRLNLYTELTEVVSIFKVLFIIEKAHI